LGLPGLPTERRQATIKTILAVSAFGAFMAFLDATVVNVAYPSIHESFPGSSVSQLSWVLNAYNIVFAGLLVAGGGLADLLGRRRVFIVGLFLFTVFSGACAAATSLDMLIAFRVLQGIGAALLVPSSMAIVVNAADPEHRAHSLSLWAAAGALAAGLGPPLGGALVDVWNWRLTFLINIPLGIAAWLLARGTIIESRAPGKRTLPDLRGAFALSAAIATLTLAIVEGGTWGWSSAPTVIAFASSAALMVLFVFSSRHHAAPVIDPQLVRIRSFTVGNLVVLAAGLGLYCYLLTHILWLHYVWGYSLLKAGLAVAPGAVIAAVVAGPCGKLSDRFGPRAVIIPGALIWAAAFWWYVTKVGLQPEFLTQWLPGQVLSGIGVGATLPIASSASLASVPRARYAAAAAVPSSTRQLGGVIGVALVTAFVASATPLQLPAALRHGWQLSGISFVAAAVIACFLGRVRSHDAISEDEDRLQPSVALAEPDVEVVPAREEVDLLTLLPDEIRERVLAVGVPRTIAAGEVLFRAGDPPGSLFLVMAGRLEVETPDGARSAVSPGASVGELALLTGELRSATITARRDTELLEITRTAADTLVSAHPEVMRAVASVLARQLQLRSPAPQSGAARSRVTAIVGLDDEVSAGSLVEIADAIDQGLSGVKVAWVDRVTPDELSRAERENDRVLQVAASSGPWHDACLRQSDHVIAVTTRPDPVPVPLLSAGSDVIVLGSRPTSAQILGWHDSVGCRRVYSLVGDKTVWAAQLRPLMSRMAGRSVALALGGGGARALAHLGVLQVFEEAGIPVDRVAGSSTAAFIAALHACGMRASEVDAVVFEELVRGRPFSDYTLPISSLVRGGKGLAMLKRCFGELSFEELPRELVVASSDLYERTTVYHRRGLVREAVAASMCVPVVFPPQVVAGRVLVEGSLTDSSPAAPLSEGDEGPVVAVRIGAGAGDPGAPGRSMSLGETLVRVMQMGSRQPGAGAAATVTVTPDTSGIGLLEFHQIDEAREAGRRAGLAAVQALNESGLLGGDTTFAIEGEVSVTAARREPDLLPS
jgi:EmrB/QacA subfamily drug resistance transporter